MLCARLRATNSIIWQTEAKLAKPIQFDLANRVRRRWLNAVVASKSACPIYLVEW
jgi:hypothetical protein